MVVERRRGDRPGQFAIVGGTRVYLSVAILLGFFEALAPVVLALGVAFAWKPRRESGVIASGVAGFAIGAALFLAAWVGKQLALMAGLQPILADASTPLHLARSAAGIGLLAGGMEEGVRFAAAWVLFRHVRRARPLRAGLLFALGWGGIEAAIVSLSAIVALMQTLGDVPAASMPPAWLPFAGLAERSSAILLHVAFTAFAVRAAMSESRAAWRLFAIAFAAHAALDAALHALYVPANAALDRARWGVAGGWLFAAELVFAAGAVALAIAASRLPISSGRSEARAPSA